MHITPDFIGLIGNTPLLRLRRLSDDTGCEILGKCEFLNPGGSVKDRAALGIIRDAERRGALRPGGLIVEGTAGNTGIGLALVGRVLGYRTLIVVPQTQSQEKKDAIRLAGATLREVPAVPYKNPDNYVRLSGRLAEELAATEPGGVLWANQFDNVANRQVHLETTGPEIWAQTGGKVDGFVCAVGTGGSLAGIGMAAPGAGTRAGPHHRHAAVRLWPALPGQAVEPCVPARERPADARLAGLRRRGQAGLDSRIKDCEPSANCRSPASPGDHRVAKLRRKVISRWRALENPGWIYSASFRRVPTQLGRRAWIAAKRSAIKAIEDQTLRGIMEEPEHVKVPIRAAVEHPFRVVERPFGHVKARYRGLAKNGAPVVALFHPGRRTAVCA